MTFLAVDANTGAPLAGVKTSGSEELIDIVFGMKRREFEVEPSGPDGVIRATDLHTSWHQLFRFHKEGYLQVNAARSRIQGQSPRVSIDLPPTDPRRNHQFQFAEPLGGVVEIKMYPQP